jgi:hypothetical protein
VSPATRRRSAKKSNASDNQNRCPECGRTFGRAQALGAHRRQAHGVAGTSRRAQARAAAVRRPGAGGRRLRTSSTANDSSRGDAVDRDRLLQALFPNGIPARAEVIRAVEAWLAEAERVVKMR